MKIYLCHATVQLTEGGESVPAVAACNNPGSDVHGFILKDKSYHTGDIWKYNLYPESPFTVHGGFVEFDIF